MTVLTFPKRHADPEDGTLNAAQTAAAVGITYRQLDVWDRSGHFPATQNLGTGYQRRYSPDEVAYVKRIARLVHAGIPISLAAQVVRACPEDSGSHIIGDGVVLVWAAEQ